MFAEPYGTHSRAGRCAGAGERAVAASASLPPLLPPVKTINRPPTRPPQPCRYPWSTEQDVEAMIADLRVRTLSLECLAACPVSPPCGLRGPAVWARCHHRVQKCGRQEEDPLNEAIAMAASTRILPPPAGQPSRWRRPVAERAACTRPQPLATLPPGPLYGAGGGAGCSGPRQLCEWEPGYACHAAEFFACCC